MQLLENLKWRYATKKFNASKKVSQKNIDYIKETIRLSAASYGLQSYQVLDVKNPELRKVLKPMSWNHTQITDASHLFVFCNQTFVSEQDVDNLIRLKSEVNKIDMNDLWAYGDFIKGKLKEKSAQEIVAWTAKQTYIALANAMAACAELHIDCTPMEGFESDAYNKTLDLTQQGLSACVLLAIGYRDDADTSQNSKKVRKPLDKIFKEI